MVTTCIACKLILEVQYYLCMLGIPIDGLVLLLGNNLSIVTNTTLPSSTLKKKHQAICYHQVRECISAKIICFIHIDSTINTSDALTKLLPSDSFLGHVWPILFCQAPQSTRSVHNATAQ